MSSYLSFLAVAAAALVLPGPDTLMVLRTSLTDGRRAGTYVAAGSAAGTVVWGAASVVGVAALLAASATAFSLLKLVGAVYLAWLGVTALRAAWRGEAVVAGGEREEVAAGAAFRRGLVCDLVNVKVGLFWTALVPQFLTTDASALMPVAMVASMGLMVFAWLAVYATAAARMRAALARTRPARALNATMGGLFVALAAKLARAEA